MRTLPSLMSRPRVRSAPSPTPADRLTLSIRTGSMPNVSIAVHTRTTAGGAERWSKNKAATQTGLAARPDTRQGGLQAGTIGTARTRRYVVDSIHDDIDTAARKYSQRGGVRISQRYE